MPRESHTMSDDVISAYERRVTGAENVAGVGHPPIAAVHEAVRSPSVIRCGLLILAIQTALTCVGCERTARWIGRRVSAIRVKPVSDIAMVRRTEYAVALAAALYPGRALC